VGQGKSGMLENKSGNISEKRKDRGKLTMDGLCKLTNALSNGKIPAPPPTASPSPKLGVRNPHSKLKCKISGKELLIQK